MSEDRTWPSLEDFRRMTPSEINAYFVSIGVDWRVREPATDAEQGPPVTPPATDLEEPR